MNAAIKRRSVERAKKMGKKSISGDIASKNASREQTVTESRLTVTKKKRVPADLL